MSAADVETKVNEAVAAQEAGDFAAALSKLRSARMLLAAIPDSTAGDSSLRYDRAAIDRMIADLQQQQTSSTVSSGGLRRTKVKYVRPDADEDC